MTIDIEKLIEEIDEDGSGEIEFDEFKALLQSDWWAMDARGLLVWFSRMILFINENFW